MRIFFDLETPLITDADPWPEPVACGWAPVGEPDAVRILALPEILPWVFRVLSEGDTLVAHNASFDAGCLARIGSEDPFGAGSPLLAIIWAAYRSGKILCSAESSRLRDVRMTGEMMPQGYALDKCVAAFVPSATPPDKSDPWRLRWAELRDVPKASWPAEAVAYLRADVATGARLAAVVCDEVDADRQAAIDFACARVGSRGFVTDRAEVQRMVRALDQQVAELRTRCPDFYKVGGTKKAPKLTRDSETIRKYARAAGVTAETPTGLTQVTEESLDGVDLKAHPNLAALVSILKLEATSTRLGYLLDAPAVRCRYRMLTNGRRGAGGLKRKAGDPGRGNVQPGTGNVQNLPRPNKAHPHTLGWRECVLPRPGMTLCVNDFGGLELATIAECSREYLGHSRLADAISAGRDAHLTMASSLAQQPEDAMVAAYGGKLGDEAKAFAKAFRQTAKPANFGLPGGLGAKRFVDFCWAQHGLRITEAEAVRIKNAWLATWPEMREWLRRAARMADSGEPVVALRSGRVRGTTAYTELCNTPFSALGADIALDALFEVVRETEVGRLVGAHAVIFAHDEIVLEAPDAWAPEAAEIQTEIMLAAGRHYLEHVPLGTDPMLMTRWIKGAETRRDASGRLTVYA